MVPQRHDVSLSQTSEGNVCATPWLCAGGQQRGNPVGLIRPKARSHFVIDYARYSSDGEKWLVYKREADGFWESDDPFPKRSVFP